MTDRLALALAELADAIRAELRAGDSGNVPDRLLSIAEAAAQLSIGRTALYGEMQAGRLRSVTIGRRRLIPAAALAGYIAERAP